METFIEKRLRETTLQLEEEHYGFRRNRSKKDLIFLNEYGISQKVWGKGKPLTLFFLDIEKECNTVSRIKLWDV